MGIQKTTIVLVACLVAMSVAFSCRPCTKKVCRFSETGKISCNDEPTAVCKPLRDDCEEVIKADGCRCCDECAKQEGEACHLDTSALYGVPASFTVPCATGLTCRRDGTKTRFGHSGTCQA